MAAPSFVAASTGATDATGAWSATCHAPGAAGRIIILQVLQDGATAGAVTFTSATNIEDLAGADNQMTQIAGPSTNGAWPVGASSEAFQYIWIGRSLSTTAPTFTGGNTTSEDTYWRFYEFSNVSTGTTLATVIENAAGDAVITQSSSAGNLHLGSASSNQKRAQSFAALGPISKVDVWLAQTTSPTDNVIVEIQTDSAGVPSGTVLATASMSATSLAGTSTAYPFIVPCDLSAGTTYWIVISRSEAVDAAHYATVGTETSSVYASGGRAVYDGSWTTSTLDLAFKVYGFPVNSTGTSNTAADSAVTTLGPDRLALNFVAVNDDNAISAFTGETGGDWTLAVAPYAESSGTDGAIGLQAAYPTVIAFEATGVSLNIGSAADRIYQAQSFTTTAATTAYSVSVLLGADVGAPADDLTIGLWSDSAGKPGTALGSVTLTDAQVTPSAWNTVSLVANLSATTRYWVVCNRSGAADASNYRVWQAGAASGTESSKADDSTPSTWPTGNTNDGAIRVYGPGTIDGGTGSIVDSDAWGVVGFALIGNTQLFEQTHYRFRNDDGNETTATWKADLDTATTYALGDVFRLRTAVKEINRGANTGFEAYVHYRKNGGAWTALGTSAADAPLRVHLVGFTDGEATTQQISSGAFVSGFCEETSIFTTSVVEPAGQTTELEWGLEIYAAASAPFVTNDVIELALLDEQDVTHMVLTKIPSFTVVAGGPTYQPRHAETFHDFR